VREYLEFTCLTEGKMFLTRSGKRPSAANWWRALNASSTKASVSPAFYPYGLRHFAASHWLATGIEPPRVASWLGNSVSVLHATYAHAIRGGEARSLSMMSAAFEQ
jgi:site-specific recombinase XerD